MNLLYSLPFWPYLYTPWLFREMAWMRSRGHQLAIVSLGDPPGPAADLKPFGLEDVPVLQVRLQYASDARLLGQLLTLGPRAWGVRPSQSLRAMRKAGGLRQGLHEWAMLKRVLAFVKQHRIDVVEAHWAAHSAMMAREITLALGIPFAVRMHGGDLYRNPSPSLQRIVESAAAICPVSQFLADLLMGQRPVEALPVVPPVEFDGRKLRICHHGLPLSTFATAPAAQSADLQVVGTIGRLDPEKRQAHLVEAIANLAPSYPGLRLRIVGGGQLEPSLLALAKERGIADRVTITGAVPWAQVIQEREKFHIYAHAAAVEGFSLATLEGISCGLPAVATRTGAHGQMIIDGVTGYLVDIEDVQGLTDKLRLLLDAGPAGRIEMAAKGLSHVREHFDYDATMGFTEETLAAISRDKITSVLS